jgi:hypothetical protein
MLTFQSFLIERATTAKQEVEDSGSAQNTPLGDAYELGTALWIHNNSGSSKNKNAEHQERVKQMKQKLVAAMSKLPPEKQEKAKQGAIDSGKAWMDDLKKKGVKPEDVLEVHHTSKGIGPLLGRKVSQAKNPPDVAIRVRKKHAEGQGPNKDLHFASLKLTPGTVSNNGTGSIDALGKEKGQVPTQLDDIWKSERAKSPVAKMKMSELDDLRRSVDPKRNKRVDPKKKALFDKVNKTYLAARQKVLSHHKKQFDSSSLSQQRAHVEYLMRAGHEPDAAYHYVVGEKGGKSMPIGEHPNVQAARAAKGFHTEIGGSRIHIYDHEGRHLLSVEHRATHGPWSSTQVNAKFEKMKVNPKFASKNPTTKKTVTQRVKQIRNEADKKTSAPPQQNPQSERMKIVNHAKIMAKT